MNQDIKPEVLEKALNWIANGRVGSSSKTMWCCFMGIENKPISYPYDPDDFSRCWKLLRAVPEWKSELHKLKALSPVWERLVDNWPRLTEYYEDMRIHHKANGMYEFMHALTHPPKVI